MPIVATGIPQREDIQRTATQEYEEPKVALSGQPSLCRQCTPLGRRAVKAFRGV